LRHLQAAYLSVKEDGSAAGGIDCGEPGCKDLFAFLQGAKSDLSGQLPASKRGLIEQALQVQYADQSGRIVVTWAPKDIRIQDLLGGLFSGGGLF
jgi:hypothetical protein